MKSGLQVRNYRVCIIQPVMKHYRIPLFETLGNMLGEQGITLHVVYSKPWLAEESKGDNVELSPSYGLKVPGYYLFNKILVQLTFSTWWNADLVIVEQANKNLLNYVLLLLRAFRLKRVAYWGHGRNRQALPDSVGEVYKRFIARRVDWWFAYTEGVSKYLIELGYPCNKITSVNNSVDTQALRNDISAINVEKANVVRAGLGYSVENRVAVYCGSLYENKRIDFLLDAAQLVYEENKFFRLLIIGGGPLEGCVREKSGERNWISFVGPKFGKEKAKLLAISELWLNPGLVGLGILDAFSAGLPVITTENPFHSPEIEYLKSGENGMIVKDDRTLYSEAIIKLLRDASELTRLRAGALESGLEYSIENMANNFTGGVVECLSRR